MLREMPPSFPSSWLWSLNGLAARQEERKEEWAIRGTGYSPWMFSHVEHNECLTDFVWEFTWERMQRPVNQTCTALACLCPAGTAPSPAGPALRVAVCCWAGLTRGEWIKINLNLMVGIPKWSFKSIRRGKSYFLRPFMALNCLSSSPSPFHWPTSRRPGVPPAAPRLRLDCLCDLRGSLLWVHLARLGADWAVLLQIQCLNIPKEWNLPAVQPVRWLLNTTPEDHKHKNPWW